MQRRKLGFLDYLLPQCMMEIDVRLCCIFQWSICMHVHAWSYAQRSMWCVCTLSIRQLLFQYQPLSCCEGRCGMEEQSICLGWGMHAEFWLGLPPVRPCCWNFSGDGSTGFPSTSALLNILIYISPLLVSHFCSPLCFSYQVLLAVVNTDLKGCVMVL